LTEHYDIVVIGSGAGGGTLTYSLAPTGKKILLLERGGFLPREPQNWEPQSIWIDGRYHNSGQWIDASTGARFSPKQNYYVGGNTKFYGAILFRFRERDFGEIRHVDGISPAWPISYGDLEPYYTRAELLYQVHGERGTDPDEAAPQDSACIRCATCDGYPCLTNGKADAQTICVTPALASPNVTLHTRSRVARLLTDAAGRTVTEIVVDHDGAQERYSADVVVVACGAINSAALLLASASDAHPDGLGNGSGVVGRPLMMHNNSSLIAFSKIPNPTKFQKTLGINDFYFGGDDWAFPLGAMQMLGKSEKVLIGFDAPEAEDPADLAMHAMDFWLTTEDLPLPGNRVTLDGDGQISLRYQPTNLEAPAAPRQIHRPP
jgi:choline dehydrogenase-like flavoprotein